ncbi:ABC transporter substrate-binding protein [Arthrobacter nitrophenolicus]|jgi:branched-chain amino acid transport system substrate-binding protein|uniref:Branched-chain amino acid transport system substrate-binding protein n=1 Tax=Arthrobacter nitrophenolicus TaxID=683150 RepID=A0ACC6TKJ2_9MICC|nr:ABC transporter substrate-binding protein [Arthrobacter nitrophenolicus]
MKNNQRRLLAVTTFAAVAALALTSCADQGAAGGGSSADGSLPGVIKLVGVRDQTGPVAYSGIGAAEGAALAAEQINQQKFLGEGVTLEITERDAAFNPQLAASEVTAALADPATAAILGPMISSEALAVAPIAQNAGIPIVFTQSGVSGLLTGNMHFRASAPTSSYFHLLTDHIAASGAKTVNVLNSSSNPTFNELGKKVLPDLLKPAGVEVTQSFEFEANVSDFQASVSKVVQENPDAVVLTLIGPQVATATVQLRKSGYKGAIYTLSAVVPNALVPAGKDGEGVIYATTFSVAQPTENVKAFVEAFKQKFGHEPNLFAAEAYDQVWWIGRAIKESGSATRQGIAEGLTKVGNQGFLGAQGQLTFEAGHDVRVEGVLVEWNGAGESLVVD